MVYSERLSMQCDYTYSYSAAVAFLVRQSESPIVAT